MQRTSIPLQDIAEDRGEHQQEGKQREERVVGDERSEAPALVVAELLDHGHRDGQPAAPLLGAIERAHGPQEVHAA